MARRRTVPMRPRRKRQWYRETVSATVLSSNSSTTLLTLNESEITGAGFGDPTLVRIRGVWRASLAAGTAFSTLYTTGIIVVQEGVDPEDVLSAGGPSTAQSRQNWLWYRQVALSNVSASSVEQCGANYDHVELDIRAMRVIRGTQKVIWVVTNHRDAAADITVSPNWSILLQE